MEDWDATHCIDLKASMKRLKTPDSDYTQLLIEVIAPEIIILLIQEDLDLDRNSAIAILEDQIAIEYGRLVAEDEIETNTSQRTGKRERSGTTSSSKKVRRRGKKRRV